MNGDTCVCCGEYIPEGRQVCLNCEKGNVVENKEHTCKIRIASSQNEVVLGENEISILIDKTSRLKNPYYMYNESMREDINNKYKVYFDNKVKTDPQFLSELKRILKLSEKHNIVLLCWCYPKPNFVETIKEWLEENRISKGGI